MGVWVSFGQASAEDIGPVGHFQRVWHMTGGRGIQDRLLQAIPGQIQHFSNQYAGMDSNRFAGLDIDLNLMAGRKNP